MNKDWIQIAEFIAAEIIGKWPKTSAGRNQATALIDDLGAVGQNFEVWSPEATVTQRWCSKSWVDDSVMHRERKIKGLVCCGKNLDLLRTSWF